VSVGSTTDATRSSIEVFGHARTEHQIAPVEERRERCRVAFDRLEAVLAQAQIADDLGAEEAVDVGGRGDFETGENLFGDAGTADDVAALEHEHLPACLREVARGHEAVVAAADDDRVVLGASTRRGTGFQIFTLMLT
jgi:hypothetical protein